jgi:hypothetical protein
LFLDGKPVRTVPVEPPGLQLPDLRPLEWCLFERQVYFRTERGRLPQTYAITHSSLPVGITLYEVRHVVISDLIVQGFQLDGINAHDNAFHAALRGLKCRGNARSGISVGGASQVTIEGCVVGNNGTAQVRVEGHSQTQIVDSDLLDNTAPPLVREGGQVQIEQGKPQTEPKPGAPQADARQTPAVTQRPVRRSAY